MARRQTEYTHACRSTHGYLAELLSSCCLCVRSSTSQVSLDRPTTSSHSPNHDRLAELRCRGTISVEQSSCCSTETRGDSAHFQETTEGLSVAHLMCWRIEGTFTTARRCCGVFVILSPILNCGLTYLLTYRSHTLFSSCAANERRRHLLVIFVRKDKATFDA